MGRITDAVCITGALDPVSPQNYVPFLGRLLNACPMSPESEVVSCEQFPTTPCSVQGQLGLSQSEQLQCN